MQLNDSYILNFNDRLPKELFAMANYSNGTHITISFNYRDSNPSMSGVIKPLGDPKIDFKFIFSVSKSRTDEFFNIFDTLSKRKLDNKVRLDNGTYGDVKIDGLKTTIKETEHTVKDMEYIRYQYEFTGNASSIIAYVFLLETSIDFFSKIWGYDEEGGEHQLLKYPVGSMVCVKGDQSADYLVIDLNYSTRGSNTIDYIVTEIKYIGSVIKYGDTKVLSERELSWSRNGRIDDILGD
jgi:hypothetical protein